MGLILIGALFGGVIGSAIQRHIDDEEHTQEIEELQEEIDTLREEAARDNNVSEGEAISFYHTHFDEGF